MAAMVSNRIRSYRCMIVAIVATGVLGTAMGMSIQANQSQPSPEDPEGLPGAPTEAPWEYPWEKIGAPAGCKGKQERDMCEYSPHGIEHNYLFEYSHDQQLDKDIKDLLLWQGIAKQDFQRLLVIKNREGKFLDTNFLSLPDIFDGKVSPNDFPIKVFLKETWKGMCSAKYWDKKHGACIGVRGPLVDACVSRRKDDSCTTASLQLMKSRHPKMKPVHNFEGECKHGGEGEVRWCKLATDVEQQVEACLGKLAGKNCEYSRDGVKYEELYKGLCMGAMGGNVLQCKGVPAVLIDACKGKWAGGKCETSGDKAFKGTCRYVDAALQCKMMGPTPMPMPRPSPGRPRPSPSPEPEPEPEPNCSSLEKEVKSMRTILDKGAYWLKKIADKVLDKPTRPIRPPPTKPVRPPPPSRRRRRRAMKKSPSF